uniref:Uncharacterized protein n=1 Tax=Ditylenchus dipsaci TaxID=166011 RepID=A0A915CTE9_9BILA
MMRKARLGKFSKAANQQRLKAESEQYCRLKEASSYKSSNGQYPQNSLSLWGIRQNAAKKRWKNYKRSTLTKE